MYIHVNYNKKFHYQKNLYNCILFAKDKNFLQKKKKKNRIQKYKKMELIIIENYYRNTKYKLSI